MPGGNGTGPMGMGPMTGRGAGPCAGFATAAPIRGRGMGCRQGFLGRGRQNRNGAPFQAPIMENAKTALKNQADALRAELEVVEKRLNEM